MKTENCRSQSVAGALALAFLLTASRPLVAAPSEGNLGNPGILPPQSHAHGMTYSDWAGAWWRWAYSIPVDSNPVVDTTGEFAALGQSGSVWFLAGAFGQTVTRTVTVPPGKALFFPIINSLWINMPAYGDNPWSEAQEAFARSFIAPFVDSAYDLSCQIDREEIRHLTQYRCTTADGEEYMVTMPDNNITGFAAAGTYGPSVDDGIYLMVAPLGHGKHTIHFTAKSMGFDGKTPFALDVTYHIAVTPERRDRN